jgi:hypothetical protein
MNDLIPANFPVRLNDLGLVFEADLDFDAWSEIGQKIGQVARTYLFWVGDWINYGQDRWNAGRRFEKMPEDQRQKYQDAMKLTGLEMDTLQIAAHVARRIPLDQRRKDLTFSHHRLVARIKDEDSRTEWLQKTQRHNLSTRRLRASLNAQKIVSENELQKPQLKTETVHLLLIRKLIQWWAEAKNKSHMEEASREYIQSIIRDFGPVLAILDDLHVRAKNATAYLDETNPPS